jgi:GAF domain-containing protein
MQDRFTAEAVAYAADDALRAIVEDVCRITGMGFAAIARVTEDRWIAYQVADRIEFGLDPGDELQIKTTICNDIRECGAQVVIDHVSADEQWRTHPTPMLYGFESYASFPIVLEDGSFFGTLCAVDPAPHEVSSAEIVQAMKRNAARAAAVLSRLRAG